MDIEELINQNLLLTKENEKLKEELNNVKEHLKKYTAPKRSKEYYQNHKEEILTKAKDYHISQDKKKEYNKRYYLNKKIKKENQDI